MIRRIAGAFAQWLLMLLLIVAVLFFNSSILALGLMLVWVLVPFVSFGLNWIAAKHIEVSVRTDTSIAKSESIMVTVTIKNRSVIPVVKANCRIEVKNKLTNQLNKQILPMSAESKGKTKGSFTVKSPYCGYLDVMVTELYLMDWFGFLPVRVRQTAKTHISVLPDTFLPNVFLHMSMTEKEDADSWSPIKKGNDQSELFALRDYVQGDSLKQIHWKLSAKKNQLIVKESSLPIEKSLLIFWDKNTKASVPEEMDAMAECVASVGQVIINQGTPFVLGWTEGRDCVFEPIDSDEQLLQTIPRMLKHGADLSGKERYSGEPEEYSKVIYFAGAVPEAAAMFRSEDITMLLCDKKARVSIPKLIVFGADSYMEDLEFVEL